MGSSVPDFDAELSSLLHDAVQVWGEDSQQVRTLRQARRSLNDLHREVATLVGRIIRLEGWA